MWEEYYNKFKRYEWSSSTQINRISKLETFGKQEEILEVAEDFCDETAASRLINKACDAGVKFSAENIIKMSYFVTETCINHVVRNTTCKFTPDQIDELYAFVDESLLEAKIKEQKIDMEVDDETDISEKKGTGLFGFLKSLFGGNVKETKEPIFSEEECFLYGIHPNDEMYRKTMELDILSKNYKQ